MVVSELHIYSQQSGTLNHTNANLPIILRSRLESSSIECNELDSLKDLQTKYVYKCIEILGNIDGSELGVKDLQNCNILLSLVFCWGIAPCLEKEIQKILLKRYQYPELDEKCQVGDDSLLLHCVESWLLIDYSSEVGRILYQKHFTELLITLLFIEKKIDPELSSNSFSIQDIYKKRTVDIMQFVLKAMSECYSMPLYIKNMIADVLTRLIIKSDGVFALMFVLSIEKEKDSLNLNHFEKISQLLVYPPSKQFPPQDFYPSVTFQLVNLLKKYKTHREVVQMASFVIVTFYNQKPRLSNAVIGKMLLDVFLRCSATIDEAKGEDLDGNCIFAEEEEIENAITALELLLANEPSTSLTSQILSVIFPLYSLYQFTFSTKSSLFTSINQILISICRLSDSNKVCHELLRIMKSAGTSQSYQLKSGATGGVVFVRNADIFDLKMDAFLVFLKTLELPNLIGEFFVNVVESHMIMSRNPEESSEEVIMVFACFILQLLETFGETLLKNVSQILKFVKSVLLDPNVENLHLGLTLLTQLLGSSNEDLEFEPSENDSIKEINIVLSTLAEHDYNSIAAMACKLRLRIAASGKVKNKSKSLELFKEAIKELSDELLPIRVHGMSILRQMVLTRDPIAEEHLDSIITIFVDLIQDSDSFVYLNAIKGCSALADVYPQETISRLAIRYKSNDFDLDYRLRIGETILQTIQRAGEVFPKLAKELLPSIMVVLREVDGRFQSSALILCSVIARQTPNILLPFLYQLLDYSLTLLNLQKEVAPRRGVLIFLSSIIRSFGFEFGAHVDRKWFTRLRERMKLMTQDPDLICRGHAQSVLQDLKQFF